jgi:hypothetical protein
VVNLCVTVNFDRHIFTLFVVICRNHLSETSLAQHFKHFKSIQNVVALLQNVVTLLVIPLWFLTLAYWLVVMNEGQFLDFLNFIVSQFTPLFF